MQPPTFTPRTAYQLLLIPWIEFQEITASLIKINELQVLLLQKMLKSEVDFYINKDLKEKNSQP